MKGVHTHTEVLGDDFRWHPVSQKYEGKIGQWNDGRLEFVDYQSTDIYWEPVIRIYNDTKLDICTTPEHKIFLYNNKEVTMERVAEGISGAILHSFYFHQLSDEVAELSEQSIRLQVAFCADGTILPNGKRWKGRIKVKKQNKIERLRLLLAGWDYKETETKGGYHIFWFCPPLLNRSLYDCFYGQDLSIVYDELYRWDGDFLNKKFRTSKIDDADMAQLIIATQGKLATITDDNRIGRIKQGKYVQTSIDYIVHELSSIFTYLKPKGYSVIKRNDKRGCMGIIVPSHKVVYRYHDFIYIGCDAY